MTLLVAGDSFAEFSGYRNHLVNAYNLEPLQGGAYKEKFKHWCELLAEELGVEIETHGIAGAGISSSAFVATQELLKKRYSGMIFFVSHHLRSITNTVVSPQDWRKHFSKFILDNDSLVNVYGMDYYKWHSTYYGRPRDTKGLIDTDSHPEIVHSNLQDIVEPDKMQVNANTSDEETIFLTHKAAYSYVHDGVTSVLALKALCDAQNIPAVFASCFADDVCSAINDMGITFKHFEFFDCEHKHNFCARNDYPSHYNGTEHQLIYEYFKSLYPEYKELFQNSQQ